MIFKIFMIVAGIVTLEFFVDILKTILDSDDSEIYDYCHGCHCGFCMEMPKTEKCKKWVDSKHDM